MWPYMNDLEAWLREDPTLNNLHGGRLYRRFPPGVKFPACRIYKATALIHDDVPVRRVRLGIGIFGGSAALGQGGTQNDIDALTEAIENLLADTTEIAISDHTYIGSVTGINSRETPDPDDGAPGALILADLSLQQLDSD